MLPQYSLFYTLTVLKQHMSYCMDKLLIKKKKQMNRNFFFNHISRRLLIFQAERKKINRHDRAKFSKHNQTTDNSHRTEMTPGSNYFEYRIIQHRLFTFSSLFDQGWIFLLFACSFLVRKKLHWLCRQDNISIAYKLPGYLLLLQEYKKNRFPLHAFFSKLSFIPNAILSEKYQYVSLNTSKFSF